jgi:hypothetical protein
VEGGIRVPLLVAIPNGAARAPVVIAVAHSGKERFLSNRPRELEALLRAGFAICLPDVRGTGETASSAELDDPDTGPAMREFDLAGSLLGSRLKDLRTVLSYLRNRSDIDGARMAVWGESFTPPNPANLYLDEIEYEAGPQIQRNAEPLGALLALLAGLYEDDVRAVLARGGLTAYLSVVEHPFTYVPMDAVVWGVLKAGDVADVAAALAPRPLAIEAAVNGRNIRTQGAELARVFAPAVGAYQRAGAANHLGIQSDARDAAAWLVTNLR